MLVFIDDSGDPGFKFQKGSSTYFVIAAVIFTKELEAERTALAIKEFRESLGFTKDSEFKFNKSKDQIRIRFLETIKAHDFYVRCIVVDKRLINSDELKNNRNSFYGYIIKTLLKHSQGSIIDAKIKIDGSGDRVFRKSFLSYLQRELRTQEKSVIKNCKLVDSKGNVLIQMADMIAGSIRRSHEFPDSKSKQFKSIIKDRIEDEWLFQ